MEPMVVTTDMIIVFCLLSLAIFLFITDLLRVDLVGLLMMTLLPLTGVLTAEQAIAGLSSNAVVSIIAVMIIGAGLNKTGIMNVVAAQIIKVAGRSENRILATISITVAVISSFMQNIGAAALFMPATMRISRQLNFSASKILMPMGFCAIIGGCLTLVGSSPLIMLNDLMQGWWQNNIEATNNKEFVPLTLFSVTPVGIALLVVAVFYFVLFGKRLLPLDVCSLDEDCMDKRLTDIYGEEVGHSYELKVPAYYPSLTLEELKIRPKYHVTVVGIAKKEGYEKEFAPTKDSLIEAGDSLWVISAEKNIQRLSDEQGWVIKPEHEVFAEENYPDESGVIEGVVIPHSNLSQHTMEELQFRGLYQVNPLAIVRRDQIIMDRINVTQLEQGDTILMQGRWKQFRLLANQMDIAFVHDIQGEELKPERTRCAIFFLLMALTLALVFEVKLSIALLTGALGMIVTRIIPADRAYEAVDWRTVFLLSGLIPLGTAFESTGAAAFIANRTLAAVGEPTPLILMLVISLLTAFFALVASNVGAVVLMVPLAMNMSATIGTDPILAGLVVAVSASNTFILPTHQVNALIMRPGGYRTKDYMKAGIVISALYTVVLLGSMKFFFGL
ncbi:SLC13 family permease [Desulforhopalus singaporensis]|uniref:TrkA-C domain-containing protein n=1 Tax=Desulforhopalus singaporensis TaxID=91360 RepID=A0A1H0L8J8_9BACT|nr:SLC13 family permease [Desulforhopalus singaporensis]SDO64589.1 TrkA-C domain-containing protein [Desulforhopalus singaporensis]